MKKLLLIVIALFTLCVVAQAQVTTSPSPLQEFSKNVVIYFHADQGDRGMMGVSSNTHVYAHTGVEVVNKSGKTESWKYAPTWNEDKPKYQLEYVSPDLWKLNIGDLREYYGVSADETITKLCFVFRTTGASRTGRAQGGGDIFVDVLDEGFYLGLESNYSKSVIFGPTTVDFTASTTEPGNISLYVNDTKLGDVTNSTSLNSSYTFNTEGKYVVKAVATQGDKTLEETLSYDYVRGSQPAASTSIPAPGITKNADGTYTFCLPAPEKSMAMVFGSWNNYATASENVMDYMDRMIDGVPFRYFMVTLPASTTGTEFGYYYLVDGAYAVGDPYAHLILDPYNDKYISKTVYPDLPTYPEQYVPANTYVAWYGDDLLAYDWQVTDFKGADKDNLVIYEMLFRDFTGTEGKADANGTVQLAIDKLPYLKQLGINAVELLPITEFNGNISWGYNTNYYFAVDKAYGTPQDYKEFIDKCHELGIAVILDVVFNQSDGGHPWYQMYNNSTDESPFYNATAPHAYSVLNDWNQGYPLVEEQWYDCVKFWLTEYNVDGFRFDLVKGLGDNTSYANNSDAATDTYNESRVARMKRIHDAMREVKPDAYFINENLAQPKEENEMAADGDLNWANVNSQGCQYAMGNQSNSNLSRMWAVKDSRTAGSTVAYLESHDEQRLAYRQITDGVSAVKNNHAVAMQRLGSAAAQMLLVPGSHMIWQFSEMGNAQNTKTNIGNNTDPKIVNWNLLNDPDNEQLMWNYASLIATRLENPELFTDSGNYTMDFSSWNSPRYITSSTEDKELFVLINPDVTKKMSKFFTFRSSNNDDYRVITHSYGSTPTFDAASGLVSIDANCYVVIGSNNVAGIDKTTVDSERDTHIFATPGTIRVIDNYGTVEVYKLDGSQVAKGKGDASIAVSPGLYIVRAGGKTAKLLVE